MADVISLKQLLYQQFAFLSQSFLLEKSGGAEILELFYGQEYAL